MATHDYVIANGTGQAVRQDLNNALAAIVSNNSSSSEPGTTYAYQWWADTTDNVLKIRNSANNAWITLRELDGTLLMEDGSASTPGLAFADDVNTGIFSPDADQIGFATGGAERLEIGSSEVVFNDPSNDVDFRVESNGQTHMLFVDAGNDRVGVGDSDPNFTLDVNGGVGIREDNNLTFHDGAGAAAFRIRGTSANKLVFERASGNESQMIIDDGKVGIGSTSPATKLAVQAGSLADGSILVGANYNGSGMAHNSDKLGAISFPMYASDTYPKGFRGMMSYASSSVNFVQIGGGTNSARSATDVIFYTATSVSANGSERGRFTSDGLTFNGDTAAANALDDYEDGTYTPTITLDSGSVTLNTSFDKLGYTKIGRVVHVQGQIVIGSVSSPSGAIDISLPFTTASLSDRADFAHQNIYTFYNGSGAPSSGLYLNRVLLNDAANTAAIRPVIGFGSEEASPGDYLGAGADIWFVVTYFAA